MRKVFFTSLLGIALALTGCKKGNKEAASVSSAAPTADTEKKTAPPSGDPAPAAVIPEAPPGETIPGDPTADPGPRPVALTDADIAFADKLIDTLAGVATTINEAGSDCPKVAAAIKAMSSEMSAVSEEGRKLGERIGSDPEARRWFEATYGSKIMSTMSKATNNPCFDDKAVQEAMAGIKGL